jgi:hypothetical protein
MTNLLQSKAVIWLCLLAGIIAIAVIIIYKQSAQRGSEVKPTELKIEQKNVDSAQLPSLFPTDFPVEQTGAKVTQNYNAASNDGRSQATRMFETNKTLDENYKIYNDYFNNTGWRLSTGINGEDTKVIIATRENLEAQVTLSNNLSNQKKIVEITIIDLK